MKVDELEKIINDAFEDKQNISDASDEKILNAISKVSSMKIDTTYKKEFEKKHLNEPTDVPYKDFKGPF